MYVWCTYAQEESFIFRDVRFPENLQNSIITNVIRDRAGLLWLSTNNGLCRYDGNEVIFFNNKSNPAISNSKITALFSDNLNNIWIGTENGLTRFNLSSWKTFLVKKLKKRGEQGEGPNIECVGQGRNGDIYAGTLDGKLYWVRGDSLELLFDINRDDPNLYSMPAVASIEEPYPGELWMRTEIGKMIRIRVKDGVFSPPEYFGLPEFDQADIREVYFHKSGKCLLNITGRGLYLFDTRKGDFRKIAALEDKKMGKDGIVFLAPSKEDDVLIFTNQADIGKEQLFIYNFSTDTIRKQKVSYPENLKNDHIEWFKNPGNTLLMSLNNHILELMPTKNRFKTMFNDGLSINSIRSIYKHSDGKLYVGSYKDRFIAVDEKTGEKEMLGKQFIYTILPWNKDSLLLGTEGDGLFWYEVEKRKLSPLALHAQEKGDRAPAEFMTSLTRVAKDSVWVGTYAGLFMVNPYSKKYRSVKHPSLAQAKILHVTAEKEKLWIGTTGGLVIWDVRTNHIQASVSKNPVYSITPVDDTFWLGTHGEGIRIMDRDGKLLQTIMNADGLADDIVYSILVDSEQVVAATHNGLSIIDKRRKRIHNYSRLDQLPANEFNQAAAFQQGNTFYLGTINGLLSFNADATSVPLERNFPKDMQLHVTSLTTEHMGEGLQRNYTFPYEKRNGLLIDAGTRYFTIGFGGLSELAKELQFFYRLDEHSDWLPLGNRQEITFVEMAPGNYELYLASRLPDGQWTDVSLIVPLFVKPSFYQTIWFRCLLGLALAMVIWMVFKYREYIQLKERRLRISIASDLHDEVGSSLTRIFYQADNLNTKVGGAGVENKQLQQIADTSRHALLTMSDMVWSIDSRFDTMKDLVMRMKDYVYRLREEFDFLYRFEIQGEYVASAVTQIVRQNLFLIFKEAITNVMKYGDGSEVRIELLFDNSLQLSIQNRYVLRKEQVPDRQGGRGLQNMRQRAAKMNAQLSIIDDDGSFQVHIYFDLGRS